MIYVKNDLARPDALLGVVRADGVEMGATPPTFDALLSEAIGARSETLTEAEDMRRQAVRDLLRNGRYKPTGRGKPASEYLVRAAARHRDPAHDASFPRINGPVDVCNYVSLKHLLPISLWDVDRAGVSAFAFRLGRAGESYVFNSAGQRIDLEDLIVGCRLVREPVDGEPIVNPVKDSLATKTTDATRRIAAAVYAPAGVVPVAALAALCADFAALLGLCGRDVATQHAVVAPGAACDV